MNVIIAITIAIIWGIIPVLQKKLLNELSNETMMVTSGIIYFIGLMGYMIIRKDKIKFDIVDKEKLKIFVTIAILSLISAMLYFYLLKKTSAGYIVILTSMYPLITIVFGHLLLGEKLNGNLSILMILIILALAFVK